LKYEEFTSMRLLWLWLFACLLQSLEIASLLSPPYIGLGTGYADCWGEQLTCDVPTAEFFEAALEAGCRLFDTAAIYGTEKPLGEALGRWFAKGHSREDVYLIAKPPSTFHMCGNCKRLKREGAKMDDCSPKRCLTGIHSVAQAVDESLRRLGVDYVDLLLMQHPAEESVKSFTEQWSQMEVAFKAGKARALGLAAVGDSHMGSWMRSPGDISRPGIFSHTELSPTVVMTEANRRLLPFRHQHVDYWQSLGILVLGGGLRRLDLDSDINMKAAATIAEERKERGENATTRQVVLKFFSQTGLTGPGPMVPETRNITHLEENLGTLKLGDLDASEVSRLSQGIHMVEDEDWYWIEEPEDDLKLGELDASEVRRLSQRFHTVEDEEHYWIEKAEDDEEDQHNWKEELEDDEEEEQHRIEEAEDDQEEAHTWIEESNHIERHVHEL